MDAGDAPLAPGGWTPAGTSILLDSLWSICQLGVRHGATSMGGPPFWQEASRLVNQKGVEGTAVLCRKRYLSVLNYFRNNQKKSKGASYPFRQRLMELHPLVDARIPATEPLDAPATGCSRRRKRQRRGQPTAPADDDHLTAGEFRAGVKTIRDDFQRVVQQFCTANAAAAAANANAAAAAPAPAPPAPPQIIIVHNLPVAPLAPQNFDIPPPAPAPLALADFGAPPAPAPAPAPVDFDFPLAPNDIGDMWGFLPDLPLPPPEEIPIED